LIYRRLTVSDTWFQTPSCDILLQTRPIRRISPFICIL